VRPVHATEAQRAYWADLEPSAPIVISGPAEAPDVIPCPAIITRSNATGDSGDVPIVRVAYELDEVELAHLAKGGTLWLSCWGGLPIHMLEVAPAPDKDHTRG